MKLSIATQVVFALVTASPFMRQSKRAARTAKLLARATRVVIQGDAKRWGFADGSAVEQIKGGMHRVVRNEQA